MKKSVAAFLLTGALLATALPVSAAQPYTSDTTQAVISHVDGSYVFRITVPKGSSKPFYRVGNGSILSTYTVGKPQAAKNGSLNYYFGYKALKKGETGIYITLGKTTHKIFESHVEGSAPLDLSYYIPKFTAYPDLSDAIALPPYEFRTDGSIGELKYVTKAVPFADILPKIDEELKAYGFSIANQRDFSELTSSLTQFKDGSQKNTYVKYQNNNRNLAPYAVQIVDGGLNANKLPILIVRMAAD